MSVSVKIHNLDITVRAIAKIGDGAPKYMQKVLMRCMQNDVWPLWVKAISLSDHSLEDLRKLGHPYSVRFSANSFVHPDYQVHKQSGGLLGASSIVSPEDGRVQLVNTSPEYVYLRYGTLRMRPRDPAGEVLAQALPLIRRRLTAEIRNAITEVMGR